jgi:hypothetical protein
MIPVCKIDNPIQVDCVPFRTEKGIRKISVPSCNKARGPDTLMNVHFVGFRTKERILPMKTTKKV